MVVGKKSVSWLSHTSTCTDTTFFAKPPTTFLTCCTGERQKIGRKESSAEPGIELTTTRS